VTLLLALDTSTRVAGVALLRRSAGAVRDDLAGRARTFTRVLVEVQSAWNGSAGNGAPEDWSSAAALVRSPACAWRSASQGHRAALGVRCGVSTLDVLGHRQLSTLPVRAVLEAGGALRDRAIRGWVMR